MVRKEKIQASQKTLQFPWGLSFGSGCIFLFLFYDERHAYLFTSLNQTYMAHEKKILGHI